MPRLVLALLILGDIAICVALYFLMGWPALLFAVPLAITTIIIFVVLQGTSMLREAARTRVQGTHQVVEGTSWPATGSGPAEWDDTFDTFAPGQSTGHHEHHGPSSSSSHSHDSGSWSSSDSGSWSSSDSGSWSSSDSGSSGSSSSSSDSGSSSSSDSGSSSSSSSE